MNTVYCYDRFATHKRLGAALLLLGATALTMTVSASASAPVQQLPRVVVSGKAVTVAQLPRVVVIGKRQAGGEGYALVAPVRVAAGF